MSRPIIDVVEQRKGGQSRWVIRLNGRHLTGYRFSQRSKAEAFAEDWREKLDHEKGWVTVDTYERKVKM